MILPYFSFKYNDVFEKMCLKAFKKHKILYKSKIMINYYYNLKVDKGQYLSLIHISEPTRPKR